MPYAVTIGSGYRAPDTGQKFTQTTYDVLGRAVQVTATDETITTYTYQNTN